MQIFPIDLAIHIVNIIVLFILLRILLFKPVRQFMAARESRIQSELSHAAQVEQQAEQLRTEYDAKLASAQATCDQLLSQSRKQGAEAAQRAVEDAEKEASEIVTKAKADAQVQKLHTMDSAKGDLADLAVDMAGRILRFDESVKANLAAGSVKKEGTCEGTLKTAQPCTDAELAVLTGKLEGLLGCHLKLQPSVDPSLLGGFAAYIDGKVYDFSYSAQLASMKRNLS